VQNMLIFDETFKRMLVSELQFVEVAHFTFKSAGID